MASYAYDSANDQLNLISGVPRNTVEGLVTDVTQLKADLGNKSSASAVTGATAFDKINTLNSALANIRKVKTAIKIVHFDSYSNGNVTNTFGLGKINVLSATSNLDSIILLPFYVRTGEQIWLKAINEQTFLPISSATDMIVTIEYVEV